ncbi:hypothetical protein MKW94_027153, partial [Papaver nudicaule]|nr:hypothetical protein [Papaver nudicaule]
MADVNGNDEPDGHYELSSFECKDGDNSIDQILWKIEIAQSKAKRLKTVVDKLLMEHAGKFSSMENLSIFASSDLPSSSARSPAFSPGHGDPMPIGALYTPPGHISEFDLADLGIPESAVSSYVEETPLPNVIGNPVGGDHAIPESAISSYVVETHLPHVIENPVGLLSAAENPLDQPQSGASSVN